jgi:hypothetical protein
LPAASQPSLFKDIQLGLEWHPAAEPAGTVLCPILRGSAAYSGFASDPANLLDEKMGFADIIHRLNIRRFTSGANKLFKLIPGDVGRPLTDIATELL